MIPATENTLSDTAMESLRRRLRFAGACHHGIETLLRRLGFAPQKVLRYAHLGPSFAFDLAECLRARSRLSHPGRPVEAALAASGRVPQEPLRYRGYWYDPVSHSLVGSVLGLDLHRHQEKYWVIESNSTPAIRPERRRLYQSDLDPFISELVLAAKARGFKRLILFHYSRWSKAYTEEFERASHDNGIEVIGANPDGSATHPMVALPEPLAANTAYVLCSRWSWQVPVLNFAHDKLLSARWLREAIEADGNPNARLASVPTSDHLVLSAAPPDGHWPNLVVKLARQDRGMFVAMGRFRTAEEARHALRLREDDPMGIPGIFDLNRRQRAAYGIRRFFPRQETVYQPFIPPDVVENRARVIRQHVFVSPLFNAFLSAHSVVGGEDLPDQLAPGLVKNNKPFCCNYSSGGCYARLEPAVAAELPAVADEFGKMVNIAMTRKFETAPVPGDDRFTLS